MSTFEDYSNKAISFHNIRKAVGIEVIVGCLKQSDIPIETMRVLDAGCGVGNYTHALLPFVGSIVGIDKNEAMLRIASGNESDDSDARFLIAAIDELPFVTNSFDVVLVTQVLHHLGDQVPGFRKHHQLVREFRRVLKRQGIIVIGASSQQQLTSSVWYFSLMPSFVIEKFRSRHIPHEDLIGLLKAEGFAYRGKFVPVDLPLQGEAYFDANGPLDENWRKSNSIWSEITNSELVAIIETWERMSQRQREAYMEEYDRIRQDIGQAIFLYALLE